MSVGLEKNAEVRRLQKWPTSPWRPDARRKASAWLLPPRRATPPTTDREPPRGRQRDTLQPRLGALFLLDCGDGLAGVSQGFGERSLAPASRPVTPPHAARRETAGANLVGREVEPDAAKPGRNGENAVRHLSYNRGYAQSFGERGDVIIDVSQAAASKGSRASRGRRTETSR